MHSVTSGVIDAVIVAEAVALAVVGMVTLGVMQPGLAAETGVGAVAAGAALTVVARSRPS